MAANPAQIASITLDEIKQELVQAKGKNDFFYLCLSTRSINQQKSKEELKGIRTAFYDQLNRRLGQEGWKKVRSFSMTYFSKKGDIETADEYMQRVRGCQDIIQELSIQELPTQSNIDGNLQINYFFSKPFFFNKDVNNQIADVTQRVKEASLDDHEDSDSSEFETDN